MRSPDSPEVLERFHAHLWLADFLALQIARSLGDHCNTDRDDLTSVGRVGLLDAARRFDPERGSFAHFAGIRIRGAVLDEVRRTSAVPLTDYYRIKALAAADTFNEGDWHRVHVGAFVPAAMSEGSAEASLDEHLQAMVDAAAVSLVVEGNGRVTSDGTAISGEDPEEAYARAEQAACIMRELDRMLDEREITASERDILHRHYTHGQTITQIATELNCSKAWVSEQHTRALTKLGVRLRELGVP